MAKGINNVCQRYNGSVLFKIKPTFGDKTVLRNSGGVYTPPFPEGYFMPQKTSSNPITKFFKQMANTMKGIIDDMKPENEVQESATGMTFEA